MKKLWLGLYNNRQVESWNECWIFVYSSQILSYNVLPIQCFVDHLMRWLSPWSEFTWKTVRNLYGNPLRCCHGNHGRVKAKYIYSKPFINCSKFPVLGILYEVIRGTWFIEIDHLLMNEDKLKRCSKWRKIWQKSLHRWILEVPYSLIQSKSLKNLLLQDRRGPQISHV